MEKRVVSGMMLTLLMFGMLTLTFHIKPVKTDQNAQLLLETDKDFYVLGENVTIVLTNIGRETIQIGGYPAWEIYTYPEEEMVYPAIFAWLAWSLEPGENDAFTWNQYNQFNDSFCGTGTYVVKDTQGWVLSAYFEIVAEEHWIPYVPSQEQWWVKEWSLTYWMENETSYVDVQLVWPDTGHKVSSWGTVVKDGYNIWVDAEMWEWTGVSLLVITYESHTYDLGYLEAGNYTFTFKAWGFPVKSISFTVTRLIGDINNDGVVDIFDVGVISAHWYPGPPIGPSGYDSSCDINCDRAVDILDIGILSVNWEQTTPTP